MIVDLAIKHNHRVAVFGHDGLISAGDVYDSQSGRAKRNYIRFEDALLIRSSVNQRGNRALDSARASGAVRVRKPGDAAQLRTPAHQYVNSEAETEADTPGVLERMFFAFRHFTCGRNSEASIRSW